MGRKKLHTRSQGDAPSGHDCSPVSAVKKIRQPLQVELRKDLPMKKLEKKVVEKKDVRERPCHIRPCKSRWLGRSWILPQKESKAQAVDPPVERVNPEPFHSWYGVRLMEQGSDAQSRDVAGRRRRSTPLRGKRKRVAKEPGKRGRTQKAGQKFEELGGKILRKGAGRAARRAKRRKKKAVLLEEEQEKRKHKKEEEEMNASDNLELEKAAAARQQRLQIVLLTKTTALGVRAARVGDRQENSRRNEDEAGRRKPTSGEELGVESERMATTLQLNTSRNVLEELCIHGTRRQAKQAMLALLSLKDDSSPWLSELYNSLYSALQESRNLATVFQSLSCIAQHRVELYDRRRLCIHSFVLKNIMKQSTDVEDEQDFKAPSNAGLLQTYALKMLVKSYLQPEEKKRPNGLDGLLYLLDRLISDNGQDRRLAPGVNLSEVDKAHVRLAAAKGILRLSQYHSAHMDPDLVKKTSLVVQDSVVEVRRNFLAKVGARLVEKRLPQTWAVVFCLATVDKEDDIASKAKKYLAELAEHKTQEAHAKQAAPDVLTPENVLQCDPETVLMRLLHLLSRHQFYPTEAEKEEAPAYELILKILVFTLKAFTHPDTATQAEANQEGNLPALFAVLGHIKGAEDVVDPVTTERMYVLADLSLSILKELTSDLLKESSAGENEVVKTKVDGSYLPKCLQDVELTRITKTPQAPRANGDLGSPAGPAAMMSSRVDISDSPYHRPTSGGPISRDREKALHAQPASRPVVPDMPCRGKRRAKSDVMLQGYMKKAKLRHETWGSHKQASRRDTVQWEANSTTRYLEEQKEQAKDLSLQLNKIHEFNQTLVEVDPDSDEQRGTEEAARPQPRTDSDCQLSARQKLDSLSYLDLACMVADENAVCATNIGDSQSNSHGEVLDAVRALPNRVAELEQDASNWTEARMTLAADLKVAQAEVMKHPLVESSPARMDEYKLQPARASLSGAELPAQQEQLAREREDHVELKFLLAPISEKVQLAAHKRRAPALTNVTVADAAAFQSGMGEHLVLLHLHHRNIMLLKAQRPRLGASQVLANPPMRLRGGSGGPSRDKTARSKVKDKGRKDERRRKRKYREEDERKETKKRRNRSGSDTEDSDRSSADEEDSDRSSRKQHEQKKRRRQKHDQEERRSEQKQRREGREDELKRKKRRRKRSGSDDEDSDSSSLERNDLKRRGTEKHVRMEKRSKKKQHREGREDEIRRSKRTRKRSRSDEEESDRSSSDREDRERSRREKRERKKRRREEKQLREGGEAYDKGNRKPDKYQRGSGRSHKQSEKERQQGHRTSRKEGTQDQELELASPELTVPTKPRLKSLVVAEQSSEQERETNAVVLEKQKRKWREAVEKKHESSLREDLRQEEERESERRSRHQGEGESERISPEQDLEETFEALDSSTHPGSHSPRTKDAGLQTEQEGTGWGNDKPQTGGPPPRRESDRLWKEIMQEGADELEKHDTYLRKVGAAESRPPIWEGLESTTETEKERLRGLCIPKVGSRPRLLLHNLEGERQTPQEVLTTLKTASDSHTRFLVGLSGCGKTRTIFERLTMEIGLFATLKPETNYAVGDFEYLIDQLGKGMRDLVATQAMREGKSDATPDKKLSEEGKRWVREENREKAKKYMKALFLSRLLILEKVLAYATEKFKPLDWLYAQLDWREEEHDLFLELFKIFSMGARVDVARELDIVERRVMKTLADGGHTGKVFFFLDELQELYQVADEFQSSQDPSKVTDLLSVLLLPEEKQRAIKWQKVASGSGLRMTNVVARGGSLVSKPDGRRRLSLEDVQTIRDFQVFTDFDRFADYVTAIVGLSLLSPNDLEDAFGWFQGRARLASDLVEQLLVVDAAPRDVIRELVEWHHSGTRLEKQREGESIYSTLAEYFTEKGKRPSWALGNNVYDVLKEVVKQWLKRGESIKLNNDQELILLDTGLARAEKDEHRNLVARPIEPLTMVAAINLLSKNEGQESLYRKYATEEMRLYFTRPALLGFLWEDTLYSLIKQWVEGPLSEYASSIFGKQKLPSYFASKGEIVPFKIEDGKIVEQNESGPAARFASGDLTLRTFLSDTKGAKYFHPEQSSGPDVVCLIRFRKARRDYYALAFIQLKLWEKLPDKEWEKALKTVEPDTFFSADVKAKDGQKPKDWRRGRRKEVRDFLAQLANNGQTVSFLEMVVTYPHEVPKEKREQAIASLKPKPTALQTIERVLGIVDGSFGLEVWGKDHLEHLEDIKPKPKRQVTLDQLAEQASEEEE